MPRRICSDAGVPRGRHVGARIVVVRSVPDVTPAEEFVEFAQSAAPRLRRTAFLLCGDWHTAEDLSQSALAKVYISWRRIRRRDAAFSYATRTLVNTYLADRRLKRVDEVLTAHLPDRPAQDTGPENRMLLLTALAALPAKARAVVVLRYWEDLSVDQAADVLGCTPGNIKSQSARALDKLRAGLGAAGPEAVPLRRADAADLAKEVASDG
jgi:RNA polymerase sigma-70 factor (sigma-E family)